MPFSVIFRKQNDVDGLEKAREDSHSVFARKFFRSAKSCWTKVFWLTLEQILGLSSSAIVTFIKPDDAQPTARPDT